MSSMGRFVHKLMPLRLPSGWHVVKNYFVDESPIIENGQIVNAQFFGEDLLALNYTRKTYAGGPEWVDSKYYIWLGWFPEFSAEGQYILSASRDDDSIGEYKSKSGKDISIILDTWIQVMHINDRPIRELKHAGALLDKYNEAKR